METKEMKEMVITYETLFDLLKREKDRVELQRLEPEFLSNVLAYLREKRQFGAQQESASYDEKMKSHREMDNIRKIIKELYDRREKKIVMIAIDQSRTKSNLVDFSHMLKEERELFEQLMRILDGFREGVLSNILNERLPAIYTALDEKRISAHPQSNSSVGPSSSISIQPAQQPSISDEKTTALVRFLHPVPKFIGPELNEYGPFSEDDIANLPREIAQVLIGKGRVEELHEE
jgi:DNA replication initiation complex subunit (GINS family)